MSERVFDWNIYKEGNNLIIELNGGINSILDMTHEMFQENMRKKKQEIVFYSTFTKTSIRGGNLIGLGCD